MTSTRNPGFRLLSTALAAVFLGSFLVAVAPTAQADPCNGAHWDDSGYGPSWSYYRTHTCVGWSDTCTGYEHDVVYREYSPYGRYEQHDNTCVGVSDNCTGAGFTEERSYTAWRYFDGGFVYYQEESCAGISEYCTGYWFHNDFDSRCIGYYDGPADIELDAIQVLA